MADLAAGRAPQVQRSSEEQARVQAAITALFEEHISFNKLLGLKVQSLAADDLHVGFDMQPQWVGHFSSGRLHGGVTAAVLDATCGLALMAALAERHAGDNAAQVLTRIQRMGTIDLRVDYLRAGVSSASSSAATSCAWAGTSAPFKPACATKRACSSPPGQRPTLRREWGA